MFLLHSCTDGITCHWLQFHSPNLDARCICLCWDIQNWMKKSVWSSFYRVFWFKRPLTSERFTKTRGEYDTHTQISKLFSLNHQVWSVRKECSETAKGGQYIRKNPIVSKIIVDRKHSIEMCFIRILSVKMFGYSKAIYSAFSVAYFESRLSQSRAHNTLFTGMHFVNLIHI